MHITISCVGCSLVAGLFYQLSSLNGNVEFFHSAKGITIIALIMIFYATPSFAILVWAWDYDATIEYVKQNYKNSYDLFKTAGTCHALILDFKGKAHYGFLAFQVCIVWIVASIVAWKIHRKLASMKSMLSSATLKARKQLLIALCFQMTIPSMLIVLPLVVILISIVAGGKYINSEFLKNLKICIKLNSFSNFKYCNARDSFTFAGQCFISAIYYNTISKSCYRRI